MEHATATAREIVETALGLLRTGYAFPGLAERAAAAIEVRLAAGEYDGMNEAALRRHPYRLSRRLLFAG